MAIFHLSIIPVSRGAGRNVVAVAAYWAAVDLDCKRTGIRANHANRGSVEAAFIVAPEGAEWAMDRSVLWNAVEAKEKRVDARVATEVSIGLPHELTRDQREEAAREFAQALVERYKVVIDVAIHAPSADGDQRNWHAHLLMTTREVTAEGLGQKSEFSTSNWVLAERGRPTTRDQICEIRALWEHMANLALARAGRNERLDARSYAARGIDLQPTVHVGRAATAMMCAGQATVMEEVAREARAISAELLRINPEKAIALVEGERSDFDRRDVERVVRRFVDDPGLSQDILERALAHQSVVRLAPELRDPVSGKVVQEARYTTKSRAGRDG